MTDKQIIIDGVKTSKEDFIDNFSIELTNRNIFEREQIGDKYFEIILAKEQEVDVLKAENIKFTLDTKKLVAQYSAKLEELKAENKRLDNELYITIEEGRAWYDLMERYEQALKDIKELAEKHAPRCNDSADCDFECEACHLRDLKQILQKISEVEND